MVFSSKTKQRCETYGLVFLTNARAFNGLQSVTTIFYFFLTESEGYMDKKEATLFLKKRARRSTTNYNNNNNHNNENADSEGKMDDAYSECCVKGCTLREVAEYSC